jgi:ParB-like chromosome segregation protein Spo0J
MASSRERRPPASAPGRSSFKQNAETHSTNTDTVKQQAAEQIADHAAPTGTSPTVHAAAMEFDLLPGEEFAELVADIKANGLIHPITLDKEGALLDGRNRLKACEIAGVEPRFETYEGDDPVAYIIACNIRRRHLTKQEQADLIVAALSIRTDLATMAKSVTRGEAGQLAGSTKDALKSAAVEEGAKHGISPRTVERALAKARPTPATRARRGAARPRSPRPGGRRKSDAAPPKLISLAWSRASAEDKKHFLSAIGFNDWWSCAPGEFREKARSAGNTTEADVEQTPSQVRTVKLSTPPASAGEEDQAAADPMAIPAALKRTPPTDRFGRPRPEPGSLLKPDKKRRSEERT